MKCFRCSGPHSIRDCPEPPKEGEAEARAARFNSSSSDGGFDRAPRGPMVCYNCNGEGHMSRDCPEPRKPRTFSSGGDSRGPMKCYK
jgi:cellular nucleic acid-binding protein